MMLNLAIKAIKYLKENYKLPNEGILAGGSLANLIWEYKSGNKAIINDIDIFVFDKKIKLEDTYPVRNNLFYKKPGLVIENITHSYEDMVKKNKDSFYQITSTEQEDMVNYIHYDSNKKGIFNIINVFDFNCTQIGYDLQTEDFLWTNEFEEFINTGIIKCTNLQSPVHSIVRLPKKCDDLNVELPTEELILLCYTLSCNLPDINKRYISEKYLNYFFKYKNILTEYVNYKREPSVEDYLLKEKKVNLKVFSLTPVDKYRIRYKDDFLFKSCYDLLFYWRYIKDFPNRKVNWKFHRISDYNPNYFDENIDLFDFEILKDYYMYDNKVLSGKSVKEQVEFLKKLESKLGNQKTKLILRHVKAGNLNPDDETDLTLMELSIRKLNSNIEKNSFYDFDI